MERKPLRMGSVKEVYDLGRELEFRFTDRISVFDKVIPSLIPHKGETLCREGVHWFSRAEKMGIKTHFEKFLPPNGMLVRKVDVIQPENIRPGAGNYLIPLEVICRWYAAGSIFDRLLAGKVKAEYLGFPRGHKVEYGEPLPEPYIEVSTKLERVDRLLDRDEALRISKLSPQTSVLGLNNGMTTLGSSGWTVAMLGPFCRLHVGQARQRLSETVSPPCCEAMTWST